MLEVLHIVIIAYLIGANILGFTLLRIQKKEKLRLELCPADPEEVLRHHRREEEIRGKEEISDTVARQDADRKPDPGPEQAGPDSSESEGRTEDPKEEDPRDIKPSEKDMKNDRSKKPVKDIVLLLVAALGGAAALYLGMFLLRFKLKNVPFMLLLPALIGLHIGLIVLVFVRGVLIV